ncbi:DNA polymerase I [Candidatus Parcubacteria bacterium]|nr:DNA polymerase I [Candidatus Parcubacteria bacterium]
MVEKKYPKSSPPRDKLMVIDGNALVHRSFHALPSTMMTKKGEVVNAVYGFAGFLIKAIRELRPEYVVLTMDKKGPTFRHKKFKAYKAKRIKAPQELYDQIPLVKELATAFDIPIFEKTSFEADDLIGTIVNKVDGAVDKIILTGDMDTLQLVNDHTKVYSMSRGITESIIYDESLVASRFGITPEQMIDYKALRGDPSDNIPGVRGVGEKTAVVLLNKFKTLDRVYAEVKKNSKVIQSLVTSRIIDLLSDHKKEAYLSKDLATIKCDVPLKFSLEKTRFRTYDQAKVMEFFSKMEFKSLLPRLAALGNSSIVQTKEERAIKTADKFERNKREFKYTLVDNEKKFKLFFVKLKQQKSFTYDTETSGFDPLTASLLGISFSWEEGTAYYVNLKMDSQGASGFSRRFAPPSYAKASAGRQDDSGVDLFNYRIAKSKEQRTRNTHPWVEKLRPIFENENIKKRAHNAKFDIRVIRNQEINIKGVDFDTMVASYLLNPGTRQHNLDALTFSELQFEKINKNDLLGKGRERISFSEVKDDKLSLYSCEDADFTQRLVKHLRPKLAKKKLDKLFKTIEMPLVPVLANMEDQGIKLNTEFLNAMSKVMQGKIRQIEKKIHKQSGEEFNIASPKQLQVILFDKLEIPTERIAKTKTGISTAASELDKLMDLHPIIKLIQEYRELTKLTSTYVEALPELINKRTRRLHTSFNQTVAATGRLSSSSPNLQNIPVRTELGREIRKAFVSEPGHTLVALDYSQIELRLAAHYSSDPKMIKAFKNNVDIHTSTAAEIHQVNPSVVDKQMRREAKAVNFGILYGQGPHGLAQTADIPYVRAREFIEQYFIVYKDIRKFINNTLDQTRRDGQATTLFGRIRPLPEINSTVTMVRKAAERMAVNTPLQGTAADMIKLAMIEVDKKITNPDIRMILTVHDELVFEIKNSLVKQTVPKIKKIMENVIKLKVPVIVDVKQGKNWGELK